MANKKTNNGTKEKAGVGRPSAYNNTIPIRAYKLCLLGLTDEELALAFDVSVTTINNWKNEHPEFLDALKRGKQEADAEIAHSLFHRAKGYSHPDIYVFPQTIKEYDERGKLVSSRTEPKILDIIKHYPPDTTACIFWEQNRQKEKWRDVRYHKHAGDETGSPIKHKVELAKTVDLSDLTDEELVLLEKVGLKLEDKKDDQKDQ